jgi:hypothetical protein
MSSTPTSLAVVIYTNDDTTATAVLVLGESEGEVEAKGESEGEVEAKGESEDEVEAKGESEGKSEVKDEDKDEDDDAISKSILLGRF